jgi:hypothetical protein
MVVSVGEADSFMNFKLFRLLQYFSLSELCHIPEVALDLKRLRFSKKLQLNIISWVQNEKQGMSICMQSKDTVQKYSLTQILGKKNVKKYVKLRKNLRLVSILV